MFLLSFEVQIGRAQLRAVEKIEIVSSQATLADTCVISLPAQERGRGFELEKIVKRGDAVLVKLGYDNDLRTEFVGYVKAVKPNSPLQIECEDALFLTRRELPNKVFKNTTAVEILRYTVNELNKTLPKTQQLEVVAEATGFQYRTFSIHQATGFEVLEKLRTDTGLAIFARGQKIHLHLQYGYKAGQQVNYDFAKNIEDSNELEYARAGETKLLVKVTGKDAKGKKLEAKAGEQGGDVQVINRPTVSDLGALQKIAQQTLNAKQYEGYRGAIRGWLLPYCEVGYSARVKDAGYPERAGRYYVSSVKTEFSANGGVRNVGLSIKLS